MRALRGHMGVGGACTCTQAGEFGQALLHQVAEGAIGNLREQRLAALGQARLAIKGAQVHVGGLLCVKELRQRRGFA